MRFLLLMLPILLSGCNALMNAKGAEQPVRLIGENTFHTTCSGAVEDWGYCTRKAMKKCPQGYEAVNKIENPVGGRRELTFKCR